jgi:hypothetical protein
MSIVAYECADHGRILECEVTEAGERVCPMCSEPVRGFTSGVNRGP